MILQARQHRIEFPRPPLVMGIVNLSEDSFSGDGLGDPRAALGRAEAFLKEGAEIIDIGAESARTNRGPISAGEETDRLCAFVKLWKEAALGGMLSINTWRPEVARAVLACGGDLLNDIGALPTDENARICAQTGAALLVMHSVGLPKVAHTHVGYSDVWEALESFFETRISIALGAGLAREALVLDPGIDFAKQRADNLRVYAGLERLQRFERPILLPVSRKTVIGDVLGVSEPSERDAGTVACLVQGMLRGAHIFRVHEVRAAVQAVRVIEAVLGADRDSGSGNCGTKVAGGSDRP